MAQINTSAINFGLTRPELSNALLQGYQQSQAFEQDLAQKQLQNQAMTQELQSQAQAQQALAGGVGITDPRLLQYGKRGMEVFKTGIAAQKSNIETLQKRLDVIGSAAGVVRSNPTVENFNSVLRDLVNNGAMTMAEAQQALTETGNDPAKIKTYADKAFTQALSAKDQIAKYFSQDVGGAYQIMGVDPVTGKANVVSRTGKSLTPGQALEQQQWQQIMGGGGGAGFGAGAGAAPVTGGAPVSGRAPVTSGVPVTGAAPTGTTPARTNAMITGTEGADTTTVSEQPNVLQQIAELDAEIARVFRIPGKPAADRVQLLIAQKKSIIEGEQFRKAPTQAYEQSYGTNVGRTQAERDDNVVTRAQNAATVSIPKLDETLQLLREGDVTTGFGAELRNNIDRARAMFANDIKAGKRVADTQILDAMLGSDVFPMIQSLGIGARGLDTPAERDYLRQVMTGTIPMDKEALIRLTEIRRNIELRAIEKYNEQVKSGRLNKYFQTQGIEARPIEAPTAPKPAQTKAATSTAPRQSPTTKAPPVGAIMDGYRFKGGNPADPNSWEKQ